MRTQKAKFSFHYGVEHHPANLFDAFNELGHSPPRGDDREELDGLFSRLCELYARAR
jgi:hypothetical protein